MFVVSLIPRFHERGSLRKFFRSISLGKLANSSNDVKEFDLPKGTHSLLCINVNLEEGYLVFWTNNSAVVERFHVLLEKIREHVANNLGVFTPKVGEMCLVYYERDGTVLLRF